MAQRIEAHPLEALEIIAYELEPGTGLTLEPAPHQRDWMLATPGGFANRCLPLLIANQSGWIIRNNATVHVSWDGGAGRDAIEVEYEDALPKYGVSSHFGSGIVTWSLPYLFRTPPGYNLWVRGPSNAPKDGVQALEGIVEADWSSATFTMNWAITRPNVRLTFELGEPICMLALSRRGELEAARPKVVPIDEDPTALQAVEAFRLSRMEFNRALAAREPEAVQDRWQKHYFRGVTPSGAAAREHQTKLRLRPFARGDVLSADA